MNTARALIAVAALTFAFSAHPAQRAAPDTTGQGYPARPIRVMVPQAPGGSNDLMARYIGGQLAERLGRQVVVDNRAGAEGMIATDIVTKAHTIRSRISTGSQCSAKRR
jgi:tripartite-type tricarboxylate transporter receptor subunit TctC